MISSLFLQACRLQPVARPPVWMMRQAGRYLPEYRAVRAQVDFLTLCRTPDLAAEVTMQPVELLEVDAAVIFSDILLILDAMGLPLSFVNGDGPRFSKTISHEDEINELDITHITQKLSYVYNAIRITSQKLNTLNIPVIGFAGAPFTLAAYAIEGETSREFHRTKKFLFQNPAGFQKLLKKLSQAIVEHLDVQLTAGAQAVQIFDTWGGLLGREVYEKYVLPSMQEIFTSLKQRGCPTIFYMNGSTPHLENMARSGADVLSVDWRLPLTEVRKRIGKKVALQGNLDPTQLYASPDCIKEITLNMLREHPDPGYIVNLGHGILPDTPVNHVKAFLQTVRSR
ncbi:MAG: uroporphyrinogen decarboxylase [Verrucomicrobiae bacterium]|nr:uroporphyrinogen decarboxylase [Verrucomicrobiae bacterium]